MMYQTFTLVLTLLLTSSFLEARESQQADSANPDGALAQEEPQRGFLGLQYGYEEPEPGANATHGRFRVLAIYPDGPAQKAGLQKDDLITAVNGVPFRFDDDIAVFRAFDWVRLGDEVELTVARNGATRTLSLTATKMPAAIAQGRPEFARRLEVSHARRNLMAFASGNGTELTLERDASTSELKVSADGLSQQLADELEQALMSLHIGSYIENLRPGDQMKVRISVDHDDRRLTTEVTEAPPYLTKPAPAPGLQDGLYQR